MAHIALYMVLTDHDTETDQRRRPPVVDSDLLRFLNAQKTARQTNSTSQKLPEQQQRWNNIASEITNFFAPPSPLPEAAPLDDPHTQWLRQFQENSVMKALQSYVKPTDDTPVLQATIRLAGSRVQSEALARTARRRVREFLRQRDAEWTGRTTKSTQVKTQRTSVQNMEQVVQVMTEHGLIVRDISEIFAHSPGVALMQPRRDDSLKSNGETLEDTLERVTGILRGALKLKTADTRRIIRDTPGLLTMRGSKSAEEIIVMMSRLQVTTKSLARNRKELPALLSRSPAAVFKLVAFLSSIRMPVKQIGPLLRRECCQDLLNAVAPVPRLEELIRSRRQINAQVANGLPEAEFEILEDEWDEDESTNPSARSALFGRQSQVRRERINDLYKDMSITAWILRNKIGTEDLGKVISAYPSVLLLDVRTQILPVAKYLMQDLGIFRDDLPRILQLYPTLLGVPLDDLQKTEAYLLSLDIDPSRLPQLIRAFPALLTMDIETQMQPVVEFLRDSLGISDVGRFVTRMPAVLGYSIEIDLTPKWELLQSVNSNARFEVSRFPAFFTYPLSRVRCRYAYLEEVKQLPARLLRVDEVVRYGDNDFAMKVAGDVDGGNFADFVAGRK